MTTTSNDSKHIVNFLRESNISKYTNIMSSEDVIQELLSVSTNKASQDLSEKVKSEPEILKAISDVFQSITTEPLTINEILAMLYENYGKVIVPDVDPTSKAIVDAQNKKNAEILQSLGNFITIIYAEDFNLNLNSRNKYLKYNAQETKFEEAKNGKVKFSETPFSLKKIAPITKSGKYQHGSTYGIVNEDYIKETKGQNTDVPLYNLEEMCHAKFDVLNPSDANEVNQKKDENFVNGTTNSKLISSKAKPGFAYVLMDQPDLRIGTRNSLELATFFNMLSTVELSKCQPFLNTTFVLPNFVKNSTSSYKLYKTASITQFLDGTPIGGQTTDNYRAFEAGFERNIQSKTGTTTQSAINSNISAFTMPQTINNFNEKFIGHNENVNINTDFSFRRSTSVHDITRPFMTIKSFNIDVAPTQGLMSFKTGKLSIVLHDRTRMVDIAPFVKPDLFGSFGAEIAIEYGWSHIDSNINDKGKVNNVKNYLGEFLNSSRVIEKYIITNSSFSMDNTGQINIELSIAMRGPVDIRSVTLSSDPAFSLQASVVGTKANTVIQEIGNLKSGGLLHGTGALEKITQAIGNEINTVGDDSNDAKVADLSISKKLCTATKLKNLRKAIKNAKFPHEFVKAFAEWSFYKKKGKKAGQYLIINPLTIGPINYDNYGDFIAGNPNDEKRSRLKNEDEIKEDEKNHNKSIAELRDKVKESEGQLEGYALKENAPQSLRDILKNRKEALTAALEAAPELDSLTYKKAYVSFSKNIQGVKSEVAYILDEDIEVVREKFLTIVSYLSQVNTSYVGVGRKAREAENSLLAKLIGGLDKADPFYNTEWQTQYERICKNKEVSNGVTVQGLGTDVGNTPFITFGSFLTGLIGTHLSCTGKFDEIQVISYTCNENCGLMSNLNVSSILLPRRALRKFLANLFEDGTTMTLEGVISQVINRFISTRTCISYGLSDFYERDKADAVKAKDPAKIQKKKINNQLRKIYSMLANEQTTPKDLETSELDDIKFVMPRVKFTFDTLTTKKSGYDTTISRISIFDQNDNPFGSINTIMKGIYDRGIITVSAQLNKLRRNYESGLLNEEAKANQASEKAAAAKQKKEKSKSTNPAKKPAKESRAKLSRNDRLSLRKKQKIAKEKFYKKSWSYIQSLINTGQLVDLGNGIYEIRDTFKLDTLKNSFKNIMPSLTYGSQNSAIIEASVSTVNESKLNTVYLTRSDRAADSKNLIAAKVAFAKDMPLRVLPSQATITIFGCPFVNFAQYIFLDFETGTTIDNSYAITGIKHDLTPGKFTTQLTLSYGDVYGKYENAAKTIARTINDILKPEQITGADNSKTITILSFDKVKIPKGKIDNRVYKDGIYKVIKLSSTLLDPKNGNIIFGKNLKFKINVTPWSLNKVSITKEPTTNKKGKDDVMQFVIDAYYNSNRDDPNNAIRRDVEVKIDLLKSDMFKKFFNKDLDKVQKANTNNTEILSFAEYIYAINYNTTYNTQKAILNAKNKKPIDTSKIKIAGHEIFESISVDFIKNETIKKSKKKSKKNKKVTANQDQTILKFIKEIISNNLTLKLEFKFKPESVSEPISPKDIVPKVVLDWDTSNFSDLMKTYKKYGDINEIKSIATLSTKYKDYIHEMLITKKYRGKEGKNFKINRIAGIKESVGDFNTGKKTPQQLKIYLKEGSLESTRLGIEFEMISGIKSLKQYKKNTTPIFEATLEYEKVVIRWDSILNNIFNVSGNTSITTE